MSIKLHRCRFTFLRSRRKEIERLTGQRLLPVIEFEDGSAYGEESADMAATIRSGQLDTKRAAAAS